MATSSIFNEVKAKDKRSISKLVNALERSSASKHEPVVMSRSVNTMSKEEIQKLFGGDNEGV